MKTLKSTLKLKPLIITLILMVLVGGAAYYFFSPEGSSLSASETQKATAKILGRDINNGPQAPAGNGVYKGKYISFRYPISAKPYTYNHKNIVKQPGVLESFQFESTTPKYFFNVQVNDASVAASLDELSGVGMREANPTDYKASKGTSGKLIFTKDNTDGSEMSEFFEQNKHYYMFIISGGDLSEMKQVFDQVLSSSSYN